MSHTSLLRRQLKPGSEYLSTLRISLAVMMLLIFFPLLETNPVYADELIPEKLTGKGAFTFDYKHIKRMRVWYYIPSDSKPTTPVLFVMHGVKRNADEYRDGWVQAAESAGFILVVPEYSQAQFPMSRSYNLGNMFTEDGDFHPENLWSFNLIEPIFELVQAKTGNNTKNYHLFGHSAGSQFVHRYLIFASYQRLGLLMAANAGWYTALDDRQDFPYGLKNSPKKVAQLAKIFGQNVVVMLGEKDNDPNAEHLRQTPEARAQGAHRVARGKRFFEQAKHIAQKQQWPFKWRLVTVPNVGHDNKGMADMAAKLLTEYVSAN